MNDKQLANEIYRIIEPLWNKMPNTIYNVRVVIPKYGDKVNIFFEWNKVGKSTTSRPIKSYPAKYQPMMNDVIDILKSEHKLNVVVYN
ncbi:hypothetical protein [Fructobacillus sp. CRL 2054]|uniref:hypothetical protein n=1 Tax=Fructobacillus sp. CRL 2054 TaxID=2763007 RepID=UPI0023796CAE|nr:hypothetical protein [Fructobacillus sp. CRL 2054]